MGTHEGQCAAVGPEKEEGIRRKAGEKEFRGNCSRVTEAERTMWEPGSLSP